MNGGNTYNNKKRQRHHSGSHTGPNKRHSPLLPLNGPHEPPTVYLQAETENSNHDSDIEIINNPASIDEEQICAISILELPLELIMSILRHLDSSWLTTPTRLDEHHHGKRRTWTATRQNIFHVRLTCSILRSVTDSPELWATHLLLRSNSVSLPSMSSISPFKHDELTLRHVTSLLIVLEDSLSTLRENRELLLELMSRCSIQHLTLIRRTSAAESFIRSQVLADFTSTELVMQHLCEATSLLTSLRRLTLVNVVLRPSLIETIHDASTSLAHLDTHWCEVKLPSMDARKVQRLNESLLLSVDTSATFSKPTSGAQSDQKETARAWTHNTSHSQVTMSREAQISFEYQPNHNLAFATLELDGAFSYMFCSMIVSPLLQHLDINYASAAHPPELQRLQKGLEHVRDHCPHLTSFRLHFGPLAKDAPLDIGSVLATLKSSQLVEISCDVAVSQEFVPQLVTLISRNPNLVFLDLRISLSQITGTSPKQDDATEGNIITSVGSAPALSSTSMASPAPQKAPTSHSTSFLPTFGSSFLPQPGNLAPLAGLFSFSAPAASQSPSPAQAVKTSDELVPRSSSILRALSEHCSGLKWLRLTSVGAGRAFNNSHLYDDWSELNFPKLRHLQYNVVGLPNHAFANARRKFPELRCLDLSHCNTQSAVASLAELGQLRSLKELRLEGCDVDPHSLMSFFESRHACAKLVRLDLRVATPRGLDSLLLSRIAHSCSRLKHLTFSVTRTASSFAINASNLSASSLPPSFSSPAGATAPLTLQTFGTLVNHCRKLKTIQVTDRTSITSVIFDLLQRNGILVKYA